MRAGGAGLIRRLGDVCIDLDGGVQYCIHLPLQCTIFFFDFGFCLVFVFFMGLFTKENCWVKRPGTGRIKAVDYEKVLGCVASCDLPINTQVSWEDIRK